MALPMLADFAVRLACGLAGLLLLTSWRAVPLAFFRTHCQVILGLLVLAALAASRATPGVVAAVVAAAVLAFLASVTWGLGLPRVAVPVTVAIVAGTAGVLIAVSRAAPVELWALNGSARLASAFLMGSTLTAMLLGHHYLTAPAMSIDPLRRFVACMGVGLALRAAVGGLAYWAWSAGWTASAAGPSVSPFLLAVRWGMGFVGPVVATVLTWKTVQIRSKQSATGILYIAMTLVLFGELTALILSPEAGLIL